MGCLEELKEKALKKCSDDKGFWTCTGALSNNLYELANNIRSLSTCTFLYHVNPALNRNDFAKWIKNVLGDEDLAEKLKNVSDKEQYINIIQKRIWELEEGRETFSEDMNLEVIKQKFLSDCPTREAFWSCNHVVSRNIYELMNNICALNEKDFTYHVNKDRNKNDFAKWIKDVLGDEELALKLHGVYDKEKYAEMIQKRILFLENIN